MFDLVLSIFSSTIILVVFKVLDRNKLNVFPPIVINYLVATSFGLLITENKVSAIYSNPPIWLYLSLIIGVLLIVNFYFVANSTRTAGIAVTTVAAKMSFVLPVIYSLLFDINDGFNWIKILLLTLACVAVLLVISPTKSNQIKRKDTLYPIILFFGLGVLDTLIKYSQYHYIKTDNDSSAFSAINFGIAALTGLIILAFNRRFFKQILNVKTLGLGLLLGLANFGSMYFLINALNTLKVNNSLVFGINNIGIVAFSVLVAFFIFSERFSKLKWMGFILSIIVLIFMITNF